MRVLRCIMKSSYSNKKYSVIKIYSDVIRNWRRYMVAHSRGLAMCVKAKVHIMQNNCGQISQCLTFTKSSCGEGQFGSEHGTGGSSSFPPPQLPKLNCLNPVCCCVLFFVLSMANSRFRTVFLSPRDGARGRVRPPLPPALWP